MPYSLLIIIVFVLLAMLVAVLKEDSLILKTIIMLLLIFAAFLSIDYEYSNTKIDRESIVVHKKFVPTTKPGHSHKALILSSSADVWLFRVSDDLYDSVNIRDRLMLTRRVGAITGYEYEITLNENY